MSQPPRKAALGADGSCSPWLSPQIAARTSRPGGGDAQERPNGGPECGDRIEVPALQRGDGGRQHDERESEHIGPHRRSRREKHERGEAGQHDPYGFDGLRHA